MEQIQIYEYLGNSADPIFQKIHCLEKGQTTVLGDVKVTFNINDIYEVESNQIHEAFKTIKQLYAYLLEILGLNAF